MATYCNQHWLLSHIRNSFISTDDTGMCETVMLSDDLPKHYLRKFQPDTGAPAVGQQRKTPGGNSGAASSLRPKDQLREVDFVCYPGLDQSDDEDMDLSSQSFDIQMYPEVGAHRFRSNTAQKLEKMDIARRRAARTKCINFDEEVVPPERSDFFVRKMVETAVPQEPIKTGTKLEKSQKGESLKNEQEIKENTAGGVQSKLSLQLANSPKQVQNKFMEYARFDGTSQTGIQTKRINVFLSMLPERERNYPIKICVLANAKIVEVIGLVCYKATIQYPDIPLKSIRHYALYMTEDNDDMDDFPPLDNREPCSKFGFSHLTLAERRPLAPVTRIDYHNNHPTKSMTSEEDKARLAAAAVYSLQGIELNNDEDEIATLQTDDYEERMLIHNDMLEAPVYRTFHLNIIDKRFFRTEVTLGISGERIEIDQHKNGRFWTKQKAVTYPIDSVAFCEIVERRHLKGTLRIWLKPASSNLSSSRGDGKSSSLTIDTSLARAISGASGGGPHSPTSPSHYPHQSSPFAFFNSSSSSSHPHLRFKHYDFEGDMHTAEHILNKLECILKVRSSEVRREFMIMRERKLEKNQTKKQLKM